MEATLFSILFDPSFPFCHRAVFACRSRKIIQTPIFLLVLHWKTSCTLTAGRGVFMLKITNTPPSLSSIALERIHRNNLAHDSTGSVQRDSSVPPCSTSFSFQHSRAEIYQQSTHLAVGMTDFLCCSIERKASRDLLPGTGLRLITKACAHLGL